MKIAVALTHGYADWECAYLLGAGRAFYDLKPIVVTIGGDAVVSMGGLTTLPMDPLEIVSSQTFDMLVMCGGSGWDESEFAPLVGLAEQFLRSEKTVAAICGATLGLARAGLLNERAHTSNSLVYLKGADAYRGEERYRDVKGAVRDGPLITAPGTAPARFAAEVFAAAGVAEPLVADFLQRTAEEHLAARSG